MPFCPKCKCEYREGIEKCPDCDLKLVKKLHESEDEQTATEVELVEVASLSNVADAEMARLRLSGEGIEAVVMDEISSTLYASLPLITGVRVMTRAEDAARARKILESE